MESRWSEGQVELFHALGVICEKVGKEGAAGMYMLDALGYLCCLVICLVAGEMLGLIW
jgi:hypothetical protein